MPSKATTQHVDPLACQTLPYYVSRVTCQHCPLNFFYYSYLSAVASLDSAPHVRAASQLPQHGAANVKYCCGSWAAATGVC
eukprot:2391919-Amphidinium_carterae.1